MFSPGVLSVGVWREVLSALLHTRKEYKSRTSSIILIINLGAFSPSVFTLLSGDVLAAATVGQLFFPVLHRKNMPG